MAKSVSVATGLVSSRKSKRSSRLCCCCHPAARPEATDARRTSFRISELIWRPALCSSALWVRVCICASVVWHPWRRLPPTTIYFQCTSAEAWRAAFSDKCKKGSAQRSLNCYKPRISWLKDKHFLWRKALLKLIIVLGQGRVLPPVL